MARRGAPNLRAVRRGPGRWLACVFLASILISASAFAQSAAPPDSAPSDPPMTSPHPVESYWGALPPRSDSVAVPVSDRPKAAWEHALLAPYRVVTFPVTVFSHGMGLGIGYLDRHRVPNRIASLLGPRRGPFGFLVDFRLGGLSGLGGGLTAEHSRFLGAGNTLRIRGSTTTNKDHRLGLAARFHGERGGFFELGAGFRRRPNARYFGIGPRTSEADESYFSQETAWAGATLRRSIGGASHWEVNAEYTSVSAGAPGPGHNPPTPVHFAGALPYGYGQHSYGASFGAQATHESPGLENRPDRGGIQRLRASYFEGLDRHDVRFWSFGGEVQQFITLWWPYRILALRGLCSWIEDSGGDPVPLSRLNTNDDPDLYRGYDDFRWRDRGMMILTAEYRWPVWAFQKQRGPGVDAYLLTDTGQVFGNTQEIGFRNFNMSVGGGLRVESGHGFVIRLEYAKSHEDGVLRLRADQVFQFAKRGYLYGREPIPAR
jgi:hypothetical protein